MNLLEQGLVLTLAGMAIVFFFLTVLVLLIRTAAAVVSLSVPAAPAVEEGSRADLAKVAAVIAAARAYHHKS